MSEIRSPSEICQVKLEIQEDFEEDNVNEINKSSSQNSSHSIVQHQCETASDKQKPNDDLHGPKFLCSLKVEAKEEYDVYIKEGIATEVDPAIAIKSEENEYSITSESFEEKVSTNMKPHTSLDDNNVDRSYVPSAWKMDPMTFKKFRDIVISTADDTSKENQYTLFYGGLIQPSFWPKPLLFLRNLSHKLETADCTVITDQTFAFIHGNKKVYIRPDIYVKDVSCLTVKYKAKYDSDVITYEDCTELVDAARNLKVAAFMIAIKRSGEYELAYCNAEPHLKMGMTFHFGGSANKVKEVDDDEREWISLEEEIVSFDSTSNVGAAGISPAHVSPRHTA